MALNTDRRTVDLSAFPDLVVIYLGMRVNKPRGLRTLLRFGLEVCVVPEGTMEMRLTA